MPYVLLNVSSEAALGALRSNPAIQVIWEEPTPANAPVTHRQKSPPLLIELYSEQALELLRILEKLGILRILSDESVIT